jgi:hypothetical protein
MQTTFKLIGWNDRGVVLNESNKLFSQDKLFLMPSDTLRNIIGLWRIFNKPNHVIVTEDNQLLFHVH